MGTNYAAGQLARALTTAATHEDEAARSRAALRAEKWRAVLSGMLRGRLAIGSRTPVAGLPAWVTPEVVHGGFATGAAVASGPLTRHEMAVSRRNGLPLSRQAVFVHYVGEEGLAALTGMLDSGGFRVEVPEESALLVVAWLARAGLGAEALDLLEVLRPYADRLRFSPTPAPALPAADPSLVWRRTAGETAAALRSRRPNARVETQRTTLQVWNGFADKLLGLWRETEVDGRLGAFADAPREGTASVGRDEPWARRAEAAVAEHRALTVAHPPSKRHGGPKANVTVLVTALDDLLHGRPWRGGLVRTAVDAMVRKRGVPGSASHAALRSWQEQVASQPGHCEIAVAVAARFAELPADAGVTEIDAVWPPEADVPASIERVARRATAGTVEELLAAGLVPSAEVLASFVPRMTARAVAAAYPSADLRGVMAATYLAFRKRRTLLLTGLASQVRMEELPWVRAVAPQRSTGADARRDAAGTLRHLGGLALSSFPATLLPNPFVRELATLSREAELGLPWVEELAADIFDGRFVTKYLKAAQLAGELLAGTLYERYYGIDYPAIARLTADGKVATPFGELCRRRAGDPRGNVAANGMVIEQAQILTTHNLATLIRGAGTPAPGDAAAQCFAKASRLARGLGGPHANRQVKDIAYAWRQMLFFASLSGDASSFVAGLPAEGRLAPVVTGLREVLDGREARPFTGWTVRRHWLLGP
ncbi:hypothetical protein ACQPZX_25635 [Actinoplanes sp. CA-142083]|uniref:hypothetical protein n=1 Tax=Actinoplanes sp. CA-142083 TaxID=3239903 RepID=UPI003D8B93AD